MIYRVTDERNVSAQLVISKKIKRFNNILFILLFSGATSSVSEISRRDRRGCSRTISILVKSNVKKYKVLVYFRCIDRRSLQQTQCERCRQQTNLRRQRRRRFRSSRDNNNDHDDSHDNNDNNNNDDNINRDDFENRHNKQTRAKCLFENDDDEHIDLSMSKNPNCWTCNLTFPEFGMFLKGSKIDCFFFSNTTFFSYQLLDYAPTLW